MRTKARRLVATRPHTALPMLPAPQGERDRLLDEALELTFPASDPVAPSVRPAPPPAGAKKDP